MEIELSLNQLKLIKESLEHSICFGVFENVNKRKAECLSNRINRIVKTETEKNYSVKYKEEI